MYGIGAVINLRPSRRRGGSSLRRGDTFVAFDFTDLGVWGDVPDMPCLGLVP